MPETTFSISIEGLSLSQWEPAFRTALDQQPTPVELQLLPGRAAGTLGSRRGGGTLRVKTPEASTFAITLAAVGVVLQAAAIAVSLTLTRPQPPQPVPVPADPSGYTCTIVGRSGTRSFEIRGPGADEAVLRECLTATGPPTHITLTPHAPH